jgi:MoaA/NifB/PqqE/SkfB family radical SAM enzyme
MNDSLFQRPLVAHWFIYNGCNLNCRFCFKNIKVRSLNLVQVETILKKLSEWGIKRINYTGGEPLMRKDFITILKRTYEYGLKVDLHTNSILLNKELIKKINPYVDFYSLPLDGPDERTNEIMRGRLFSKSIFNRLNLLDTEDCKIKIKTVFTKLNYKSIPKILEVLKRYKNIVEWTIIEFRGWNEASKAAELYNVNRSEFDKLTRDLKSIKCNFNIKTIPKHDIPDLHLLINEDGEILMDPLMNEKYNQKIGLNILNQSLDKIWEKIIRIVSIATKVS